MSDPETGGVEADAESASDATGAADSPVAGAADSPVDAAVAGPVDSAVDGAVGAVAAVAAKADERLSYRGVFARMLVRPEIGAAIAAAAVWVFFWAVSGSFGVTGGTASILDVAATLGIMAVAVSMLMIGGEFDLSSGAATGALGIITLLMVRDVTGDMGGAGLSLWVALPLSLILALGLGWFNGTMVNRTSLPSFIVTLGSFFILKGAKLGFAKLLVDQIQVGKMDDLLIFAEDRGGDRGYAFFQAVFAAEWERNLRTWEARDLVYTVACLAGLTLLAIALYELRFKRKESMNPLGLAGLLVGLAGGVVGGAVGVTVYLLGDGDSDNEAAAIAMSCLVGVFGLAALTFLALALFRRLGKRQESTNLMGLAGFLAGLAGGVAGVMILHGTDSVGGNTAAAAVIGVSFLVGFLGLAVWRYERLEHLGGVEFTMPVLRALGFGVASLVLAVLFASILDPDNSENVTFLVTEQGLRAILFVALGAAGAVWLLMAAHRAGSTSQLMRSLVLFGTAAATMGIAFFIRSESATPKFRTEVFSVMLAIAALMATWAIVTALFGERRHRDPRSDTLGNRMIMAGAALFLIGVTVRLLFTVQFELDAGISPAKFSVRILWFFLFAGLATWVLGRTQFGSWVFAVGGNKEAARQIGVPAARTKTQLFMLVSFAAWLVGTLLAFRLNTIQASTGDGEEFEYIIAAVVGGTALTGGYGSTLGAGIGAIIMAMSVQGIPFSRWNSDWRFVFLGGILLVAVIANNFIRSKAEATR